MANSGKNMSPIIEYVDAREERERIMNRELHRDMKELQRKFDKEFASYRTNWTEVVGADIAINKKY